MNRLAEFRGLEGTNFFDQDRGFQLLLNSLLKDGDRERVFESLRSCGALVSGRWNELSCEGSRTENLPRLIKLDRVGRRVERVDFGRPSRQLRREVAEFGVLTRTVNELHKFALVYLLGHNGEASLTCGIACTDGLVRAIEARGSEYLKQTYLPLLGSVETPFAGAQFVTEKTGGSDVGAIETVSVANPDGTWSITGEKWFCSNPDEFFLVAARPEGAASGTAGIATFLVPRKLPGGDLNGVYFQRLKNKLGTQSLPTAEINFDQATGWAIGDPADGFKTLMNYVINTSRIHNAVGSCGLIHRAFLEARNYVRQRVAFGNALIGYPLIQEALIGLLERLWRHRVVTFRLISLVDKYGLVTEDANQAMWQRFLVNIAKYRSAALLTRSVKEAVLMLGANGIVEDFSVLPRLLRDALILETWEGPHNTLCLQIMRDAARENLIARWQSEIGSTLERWPPHFLPETKDRFLRVFSVSEKEFSARNLSDSRWTSTHARRAVDRLGILLEVAWMVQLALEESGNDMTTAVMARLAGASLPVESGEMESPIGDLPESVIASLIDEEPIDNLGRRL